MADGKIYITISDKTQDESGVGAKTTDKSTKDKKKQDEESNIAGKSAEYILFRTLENTAKSVVNYSIGNIGNFTGDYNAQRQMNETLNIGGRLLSLGTMLATGNIAGFTIAGVGMITSDVLRMNSEAQQVKKQNYEIAQLRQLSGLDQKTNGSR